MKPNRKLTTAEKKRWEREWVETQNIVAIRYRDAVAAEEHYRASQGAKPQHHSAVARRVCKGGVSLCKKLNSRIATTYNVAVSGYYDGSYLFCVSATFAEIKEMQEMFRYMYGTTFYFVKATPKWYASDQITEFLIGIKWLCRVNDCLRTDVISGQVDQQSKELQISCGLRGTDDWENGINQIMKAYRATLEKVVVTEDV